MAITIRELLASDTVSQAADKINFNFDQLLLNGGGPQGPQGPQGPPGPIGGRGIRGSVWYEGTADPTVTPPTATPEDEDNYLQSNGDVWTYDAAIPGWVNTGVNLTGPTGPTGASGKFAEYQALPYTAAGDTTIFPDELSISAIGLTQGVRSVLIGGFPEGPAFTPTSIGTNIVPTAIANQLEMPNISMMVHQFDSSGTAIMFHGGDSSPGEWFSQVSTSELSRITLVADDALRMASPKQRTSGAATFGIYIDAANRGIDLNAGRELRIRTGTATTSDTYPGQDNFSVQVAQSAGNSVEPYASISTIVSGQEAELRIGETSTPVTTTTNSGNLVGLAGKISLIGSDAMNLRTADSITVDAGTFIDIDAGTSIDIDAATTMRLESTTSTEIFSAGDINIHSKDENVNIYTDPTSGGNISITTNNSTALEGFIYIRTLDDLSPMYLFTSGSNSSGIFTFTNGTTSPISLQTFGASDIELDSGKDINMNAADAIVLNASTGTIDIDADKDITIDTPDNIIVTAGSGDIELRADGPDGDILIQSGGNLSSIDLQRVTGTSVVNVFSTSGAGSYFSVWGGADNTTNGIRLWMDNATGPSQTIAKLSPLNLTDRLLIDGFDGLGAAPTYDSGFKVDATNHLTHLVRITSGVNDDIFRSGQFVKSYTTPAVPSNVQIKINWMRVGNVVTGTGYMDPSSLSIIAGNYDVDIPIGEAAVNTIYGMWTDIDSPPTAPSSGPVGYFSSTRMRIAITTTPPGIHFTFSYVIA